MICHLGQGEFLTLEVIISLCTSRDIGQGDFFTLDKVIPHLGGDFFTLDKSGHSGVCQRDSGGVCQRDSGL